MSENKNLGTIGRRASVEQTELEAKVVSKR